MAEWLCLLLYKALEAAGGGYLVTQGRNYGTACLPRHARSRYVPELRHRIAADELATKAGLQSLDRKLGVCCVAPWNCGSAFFGHLNFLKDLITGCDCLSIYIQYQTTGCTALQTTTAGLFLYCCAAEHVAAASV